MRTLALLTLAAIPLFAADPQISDDERKKLIALLEDSRAQLRAATKDLTPEQWNFQPGPERWSIALVAEHIMRTEAGLYQYVERALAAPANAEWETKTKGKTEFLERVMPSRTGKAQAPVEVRPEGKLPPEEILASFEKLRTRTLETARTTDKPLKALTADHPFPVFGTLNAYQWLLYIPWHTQRHLKQIEEVKSSEGYPRKP